MTHGIRFATEDGNYLQISDQVPNFVLVSKGSVALSNAAVDLGSNVYPGSWARISLPNVHGYPPIIALRCAVGLAVLRARLVGGNWEYIVATRDFGVTEVVEWWAFAPFGGDINSLSKHGIIVKSQDGSRVHYHSDLRPLSVKQVVSQAGGGTALSIPAGRKLAIVVLTSMWAVSAQLPAGAWVQYLYSTGIQTTALNAGVVIPQQQFGEFRWGVNFNFGAGSSGTWSAMAVDVTGL